MVKRKSPTGTAKCGQDFVESLATVTATAGNERGAMHRLCKLLLICILINYEQHIEFHASYSNRHFHKQKICISL